MSNKFIKMNIDERVEMAVDLLKIQDNGDTVTIYYAKPALTSGGVVSVTSEYVVINEAKTESQTISLGSIIDDDVRPINLDGRLALAVKYLKAQNLEERITIQYFKHRMIQGKIMDITLNHVVIREGSSAGEAISFDDIIHLHASTGDAK